MPAGAQLSLRAVEYEPYRGALYGYTHLHAGLPPPQVEFQPCAAKAQRHAHPLPGRRQVRVQEQSRVAALDAGEAHHGRLPEAAHGGHVQAGGGVAHVVGEVDGGGHLEILHRVVHPAQPRRHGGVDAGAQRAAVAGDGLVVVVVGGRRRVVDLIRQDVREHDHVGLLDHLCLQGDLAPQHEVGGHRPRAQLVQGDVFHAVEPGELLVEQRFRVEAVHQAIDDLAPVEHLRRGQFEAAPQLLGVAGIDLVEPHERLQGALDVPAREDIGVGVVVHALMVLVGTHHEADVVPAIVSQRRARGPEARRLEQHLDAHRGHEDIVGGGLPVLPHAPRDVGRDVVLHEPAEDGDHLAVRPDAVGRRGLHALVGGLPRVQRPAVAHVARLLASPGEVAVAVGQQRARRLRMGVDEEGEHEDLRVPEHVQEVAHAAQAAGADAHRIFGRVGGADHVVDAEAQGGLVIGVAVHHQVRVAPALVPCRAVPAEQLVEAQLLRPRQRAACGVDRGHSGARRDDGGQPVDGRRVAGLETAADHVARLLHVAHDG